MGVTINDKISRAGVYLEPAVYSLVQKAAEESNESVSAWIRRMIVTTLHEQGKIDNAMLLKLASS